MFNSLFNLFFVYSLLSGFIKIKITYFFLLFMFRIFKSPVSLVWLILCPPPLYMFTSPLTCHKYLFWSTSWKHVWLQRELSWIIRIEFISKNLEFWSGIIHSKKYQRSATSGCKGLNYLRRYYQNLATNLFS